MSTPPITPLSPTQEATQEEQAERENYIERAPVAIDEAAAEILFDAPPDETISTEAAIASVEDHGFKKEVGKIVSDGLDLFQKDHGAKAAAGDLARAEAEEAIVDKSGIS